LLFAGAKGLYERTTEQATDPRLLESLGLKDNFADKYSLLVLHVWMLLVRLRSEGADGKHLAQLMYENFQDDVEVRVRAAGVKV
jgi:cytochrome b pre-mRNA-processing protein 3